MAKRIASRKKGINRQVRWNLSMDQGDQVRQRYRYVVAIINKPKQIESIERKLLDQLAPSSDLRNICDWSIPGSDGLHCKVLSFSSDVGRISDSKKIYDSSRFYLDRDLRDTDEVRLEDYLKKITRTD